MILLPSRGRPHLLQRYFDMGRPQEKGVVVIDEDELGLYAGIRYPPNWTSMTAPILSGYVAKANLAFKAYPDEPWYGYGGDDSIGRTPQWDTRLAAAVTPRSIVWPNDLMQGHCTQPFIGGDLCRALGWVCHPTLKHLYCDTVWGAIQHALHIGTYREDIVVEHLHFSTGKSTYDQTYRSRMQQGDRDAFGRIDIAALVEQLRPLCGAKT